MMTPLNIAGGLAGLATAFLWACSAMAWGLAGRRIGTLACNLLRITGAALILVVAHWIVYGKPLPLDLPPRALAMLLVSGTIGLGISDLLYFSSLIIVGPRIGMLILALSPIFASLIAWLPPLRERLDGQAIVGIILTVSSVAWVVTEKEGRASWKGPPGSSYTRGIVLGLLSALLASFGMVLSHIALTTSPGQMAVPSLSAALTRILAGMVLTILIAAFSGRVRTVLAALKDHKAMGIVLFGTVAGSTLGVWMSMLALQLNPAGVGVALISMSPIMMVPLAYLGYREKPSARAVVGTVLAMGGVAVLLLRPS